jgi:hypothetical protein
VPERYWQPHEVEALIPRLTEIMDRVRAAQREAQEARAWLAAEQERITLTGGGMLDRASWRAAQQRQEGRAGVVRQGLEEIEGLGGVTKDLETGLVDFLHLRAGREVNLCWKYGEKRITHWHGLDEGYAKRKPL